MVSSSLVHSLNPVALLSPVNLFLTSLRIPDEGAFLYIFLLYLCHLINTMHWLVNERMEGGVRGGGLPLSTLANPHPIGLLNVCMRAKTCFPCLVQCLYGQNRNTAEQEQRTTGKGVWVLEKGDISVWSYDLNNSTCGMMFLSPGKPSAQQEDDSIKVLTGGLRYVS